MMYSITKLADIARSGEKLTPKSKLGYAKHGNYMLVEQNKTKQTIYAKMHKRDGLWIGWLLDTSEDKTNYLAIVLYKNGSYVVGLTPSGFDMLLSKSGYSSYEKNQYKKKYLEDVNSNNEVNIGTKELPIFIYGKRMFKIGNSLFFNLQAMIEEGIISDSDVEQAF